MPIDYEKRFELLFYQMDFFSWELRLFDYDLHILILGTLETSLKSLRADFAKNSKFLKAKMKGTGGDFWERLAEDHGEIAAHLSDQETFLINMGLVALSTRVTLALRKMSQSAKRMKPLTNSHRKTHLNEFRRIFLDIKLRFAIDFEARPEVSAFVDEMNDVRNQIVHDGGEVNLRFAARHPQYVSKASVVVGEEQLDRFVKLCESLLDWTAGELRKCQKEHVATLTNAIEADESRQSAEV